MHRSTLLIAATATSSLINIAHADIYGADVFSAAFGSIDSADASWTSVGGTGVGMNGLAYNANDDIFYGVNAGTSMVYTIDPSTGQATSLGDRLNYNNVNGLAYDLNTDTLYATDNNTNDLMFVDLANGRSNRIATIGGGISEIEGLAFNANTSTLYGLSQVSSALVEIDTITGDTTVIASLESQVWRGLTYDGASNSLILSAVNIFESAGIYRFDLGSESLSFMGYANGAEAIQGLASTSVVPAPAALSLLALGGGLAARRRR